MLNSIWKIFWQKKCRDRRPRRSVIIVLVALLTNSTKRLVGIPKFHQTFGRSCLVGTHGDCYNAN